MAEDRLDTLMNLLEEDILATSDVDILSHPEAAHLADRTRALVDGLAGRRVMSPGPARVVGFSRDRRRSRQRREAGQRRVVQRLLVASAKARKEIGTRKVDDMTDKELDDLLHRFDAMGLITPDDAGSVM